MKKTTIILSVLFFVLVAVCGSADAAAQKKILYVDSYHNDFLWSAGIADAIESVLAERDDVELKIIHMDTKRNNSEESKKQAALQAKGVIESWKPDLVIASDDNASKYLIVPYYKNSALPFVFCGVNWDETEYGFPFSNVTGMVEVQLIDQIVEVMKKYARGGRIALLKGDDFSARKEAGFFESNFDMRLDKRFVNNFEQWKEQFLRLQTESDMILLGNGASLVDWDNDAGLKIIKDNTIVPTGNWDRWMAPYSLVTFATKPEEQGEWAAQTALDILAGKSPQDIPIVRNKKAEIYLNMKIAKKMGIKFPMELIGNANLISAEPKKILYVNSYHKGYQWSDDIEKGLLKALHVKVSADGTLDTSQSEVELKIFRMDSKINKSEVFKKQAALTAKAIIDEWQPDLVVVSDDNAAKYLVKPNYKKYAIPFVFCGVNSDASVYGFPAANVTGMLEVTPVVEIISMLKEYAKGNRLGYIGGANLSNRKDINNFTRNLGLHFTDGNLATTFDEWQSEYRRLQDAVDMLLWFNPIGIKGWDSKQAHNFILANTKIPTAGTGDSNMRFALLGRVKIAEEQGWWAGKTVLRILAGTDPADIPLAINQQSTLYLNMELAKRLQIKFPMDLLEKAIFLDNSKLREE